MKECMGLKKNQDLKLILKVIKLIKNNNNKILYHILSHGKCQIVKL